jgi:signal transduction histidine kinase
MASTDPNRRSPGRAVRPPTRLRLARRRACAARGRHSCRKRARKRHLDVQHRERPLAPDSGNRAAPRSPRLPIHGVRHNRQETILFGGWTGSSSFGDTWTYDSTTQIWSRTQPAVAPRSHWGAAMAYDPTTHQRSRPRVPPPPDPQQRISTPAPQRDTPAARTSTDPTEPRPQARSRVSVPTGEEVQLFLTAVAHDLRTPLFALTARLDALLEGITTTPDRARTYVVASRRQADHLQRLVAHT